MLAIVIQRSSYPMTELGWHGLEAYLWGVALALPLTVRRRFPLVVMVLCSISFYGMGQRLRTVISTFMVQICFFMAFYTAWAWSRQRRRLVWVTVVIVLAMFAWVFWQLATRGVSPPGAGYGVLPQSVAIAAGTITINLIYFLGAIAWGLVSSRGAKQRHDLRVQTEQLQREQDANAQRAVADERVRIARDLRDVVAHHVSGIGVQAAGASRLLDHDPDKSREALQVIERSSREAVTEMHHAVTLLRNDGGEEERGPRPGLGQIEQLTDGITNGTFQIGYRTVGTPFEVPESVGLSLYRTAQEALANVRKHSFARQAEVVLRYVDAPARAVEIEALDDGSPMRPTDSAEDRGGFGLQGIAERVNLHDGDSEIGPRPDGGFRVRVRVPVGETA